MSASAPSTPSVAALKENSSKPSPLRSKDVLLPMARVKTIMKSSPGVENIGQEALFTVTKSTELFIMYLTKLSQRHGSDQELTYNDLASVVTKKDNMEFLQDIVPKKIKYSEYLEIMEKENMAEDSFY